MIKRKEILNYVTKTKSEDVPKELFTNLVKKIYDSVGRCKHCDYYRKDGTCGRFERFMGKNDYCSLFQRVDDGKV